MAVKSTSPLISILMPVKNEELYLEDCILSIINQSYPTWELLAVDDHSTDSSFSILETYTKLDSRIKCFKNEDQGIQPALRQAYLHSTGSLITRMDADDLMPVSKLKELSHLLVTQGKGFIATGLVQYFSTNELGEGFKNYEQWLNHLTIHSTQYNEIYKECPIPSPCWMLHRSDLDLINAFHDDRYPEDYDLIFRCYQAKLQPIGVDQVLHRWRDHSQRASRTNPNYADNSFVELKIDYFLQLDKQKNKNLVLLGAGTRGKKISKRLLFQQCDFGWVSNNPRKIGRDIYGKIIMPFLSQYKTNTQYIVSISNKIEQKEIIKSLSKSNMKLGEDYFVFC